MCSASEKRKEAVLKLKEARELYERIETQEDLDSCDAILQLLTHSLLVIGFPLKSWLFGKITGSAFKELLKNQINIFYAPSLK